MYLSTPARKLIVTRLSPRESFLYEACVRCVYGPVYMTWREDFWRNYRELGIRTATFEVNATGMSVEERNLFYLERKIMGSLYFYTMLLTPEEAAIQRRDLFCLERNIRGSLRSFPEGVR